MKFTKIHSKHMMFFSLLFAAMALLPKEALSGHADALLLSCMDYRLVDETERYMTNRGLHDKYDHVILAGASLGAVTDKYPSWNQTFWDHLDVSIKLHRIKKVIILDHRDCGAYKAILGEDFSKDPVREKLVHTGKLTVLENIIKTKYPELDVELHLMDLSGSVDNISE